jgi:hypothetical protein
VAHPAGKNPGVFAQRQPVEFQLSPTTSIACGGLAGGENRSLMKPESRTSTYRLKELSETQAATASPVEFE